MKDKLRKILSKDWLKSKSKEFLSQPKLALTILVIVALLMALGAVFAMKKTSQTEPVAFEKIQKTELNVSSSSSPSATLTDFSQKTSTPTPTPTPNTNQNNVNLTNSNSNNSNSNSSGTSNSSSNNTANTSTPTPTPVPTVAPTVTAASTPMPTSPPTPTPSPTPTPMSCPSNGLVDGNSCWYLGNSGQSCNSVCQDKQKSCDSGNWNDSQSCDKGKSLTGCSTCQIETTYDTTYDTSAPQYRSSTGVCTYRSWNNSSQNCNATSLWKRICKCNN